MKHKRTPIYSPLSARAVKRILTFDQTAGFGPGGTQPNRNRFYTYLTQRGSDIQLRTVAVKAANRKEQPILKEVTRSSVDDPWLHITDLGHNGMAGYVVDWSPEGFGPERNWSYFKRWETEAYAPRCMWKITAPVVNPELLNRTRRFRWSDYRSSPAHLLDYLKTFSAHPEIEFLSKIGLGIFCTKTSIVRLLAKDRQFRRFIAQNSGFIEAAVIDVPTIIRAYKTNTPLGHALAETTARRVFRGYGLPRGISAAKAQRYINAAGIARMSYTTYLQNCQTLGLNLDDTKVSFPKQFSRRKRIIQEQTDANREKLDAVKNEKINCRIEAVAEKFQWLENTGIDYQIRIPRAAHDLVIEGRNLSNCLGQPHYATRIASGKSIILFVRETAAPNRAFVAVEYDLQSERIAQCYAAHNSKPSKKVREFIEQSLAASSHIKKAA